MKTTSKQKVSAGGLVIETDKHKWTYIRMYIKYGSANQKPTGGFGLYKAFMRDRRMFPISYGRPIGYLYLCDCIGVLINHYGVQIRPTERHLLLKKCSFVKWELVSVLILIEKKIQKEQILLATYYDIGIGNKKKNLFSEIERNIGDGCRNRVFVAFYWISNYNNKCW